jgi:hypothetical protein
VTQRSRLVSYCRAGRERRPPRRALPLVREWAPSAARCPDSAEQARIECATLAGCRAANPHGSPQVGLSALPAPPGLRAGALLRVSPSASRPERRPPHRSSLRRSSAAVAASRGVPRSLTAARKTCADDGRRTPAQLRAQRRNLKRGGGPGRGRGRIQKAIINCFHFHGPIVDGGTLVRFCQEWRYQVDGWRPNRLNRLSVRNALDSRADCIGWGEPSGLVGSGLGSALKPELGPSCSIRTTLPGCRRCTERV